MAKSAALVPLLSVIVTIATMAGTSRAWAAEDYDAATRTAIQSVISKQLDALSHDDATSAESFAAEAIRKRFATPSEFYEMVKKNYAVLLHPRSTHFGETTISPHGPLQSMTIVAADGTVWNAIYSLEQVEGGWRITGCGLSRDENQQSI